MDRQLIGRTIRLFCGVLLALPLVGATVYRTYAPATYSATPSDPGGTSSTTAVMMGLAGSITPRTTGNVLVYIGGSIANGTALKQTDFQVRRGGGAAPANGAAATGNTCGTVQTGVSVNANDKMPASALVMCTGLTLGATSWIDLAMFTQATSGPVTITGVYIAAIER